MWFGTRRAPAGGFPAFSPGGIRDKEKFYRADISTEQIFHGFPRISYVGDATVAGAKPPGTS